MKSAYSKKVRALLGTLAVAGATFLPLGTSIASANWYGGYHRYNNVHHCWDGDWDRDDWRCFNRPYVRQYHPYWNWNYGW